MMLYRTKSGPVFQVGDRPVRASLNDWDELFNAENPLEFARPGSEADSIASPTGADLLPPIGSQEVWAAGVTYLRSKTARMEESQDVGAGSFYDRVYQAARPELFFKATPQRVVGTGGSMHLRSDSKWIVPEPELTLAINRSGKIIGCTIGNDLSCRDIEGENPLYLPQAKVFKQCAALGPGIFLTPEPLPSDTEIRLEIIRDGREVFRGATLLDRLKRSNEELVEHLFRDNAFPAGCFLMTGTGIVPPDGFCLRAKDEMRITIPPIGTLVNYAAA